MKKILALMSAAVIAVSLCACSVESVEEHDKKQSSSLAEASEEGASAIRDDLDSEADLSESDEASSQVSGQEQSSEKSADATESTQKSSSEENESGASDVNTSVNNKQDSVYSYYETEYETEYVKKTVTGSNNSVTEKSTTTSKVSGKTSVAKTVKSSSSNVQTSTSKKVTKANITVSQSKIDISSVLSNTNLSESVKESLEQNNPYVKDYKMLVPSYSSITVKEGSTVLDVLELILATERKGSSEFAANPNATAGVKNSAYGKYVYSICGLAEKDCGSTSGWTYYVNGKMPSVSADKYILKSGDKIEWVYVTG